MKPKVFSTLFYVRVTFTTFAPGNCSIHGMFQRYGRQWTQAHISVTNQPLAKFGYRSFYYKDRLLVYRFSLIHQYTICMFQNFLFSSVHLFHKLILNCLKRPSNFKSFTFCFHFMSSQTSFNEIIEQTYPEFFNYLKRKNFLSTELLL